jgi:hypothetical protein
MPTFDEILAELSGLLRRLLTIVQHPISVGLRIPNPRKSLVLMAYWAKGHKAFWDYDQERPVKYVRLPRFKFDCSGAICWLYWCAGLRDPSGNNFGGGDTYTMTLLKHNRRINPREVRAGDICILGAELPVDEQHAMMALEPAPNPLCFSHGSQGDPTFVRVDIDGRSKTWVRPDLTRVRRMTWPQAK